MNKNLFHFAIVIFTLTFFPALAVAQEADVDDANVQPSVEDSSAEDSNAEGKLASCKTGDVVAIEDFLSEVAHCDVVFLGEDHDNDSGHEFQLEVIKRLVEQGVDVAISMEQFERDVQGSLNDYLAGRISEEEFKSTSRPWPNYDKHYRAIIEFAKSDAIPVIASNVPRRIASAISKSKTVAANEKVFMPRSTNLDEDGYWDNFVNTMSGHAGAEGTDRLKTFFASQCIKDDAMAEAITDFLAKNQHRPKLVVHLCGHFHSDFGLGTVSRVFDRNPLVRTTIVTMELTPKDGKLEKEGIRRRGHYVFWMVANKK